MRILVVDNYDSFVFNLVQYLGQLGTEAVVWRNDDPQLTADLEGAVAQFDGILLSPGPGTPQRAGATLDLVKVCADTKTPLLGVCLGHQAIGAAFGGTVDRAPELLHGKTSLVHHKDVGVLAGLPDPFTATPLPLADGSRGHHSRGTRGDRTHRERRRDGDASPRTADSRRPVPPPESVLTQGGHRMLANWLAVCGEAPPEGLVAALEAEVASALGGALPAIL